MISQEPMAFDRPLLSVWYARLPVVSYPLPLPVRRQDCTSSRLFGAISHGWHSLCTMSRWRTAEKMGHV